MTYRIVVAENGDSYLAKTIVVDAMVRSDGAIELRGQPVASDSGPIKSLLALAAKLNPQPEASPLDCVL